MTEPESGPIRVVARQSWNVLRKYQRSFTCILKDGQVGKASFATAFVVKIQLRLLSRCSSFFTLSFFYGVSGRLLFSVPPTSWSWSLLEGAKTLKQKVKKGVSAGGWQAVVQRLLLCTGGGSQPLMAFQMFRQLRLLSL